MKKKQIKNILSDSEVNLIFPKLNIKKKRSEWDVEIPFKKKNMKELEPIPENVQFITFDNITKPSTQILFQANKYKEENVAFSLRNEGRTISILGPCQIYLIIA